MQDDIKYQLPLGILGQLAHALFVEKKVREIFQYREKALNNIFGVKELNKL